MIPHTDVLNISIYTILLNTRIWCFPDQAFYSKESYSFCAPQTVSSSRLENVSFVFLSSVPPSTVQFSSVAQSCPTLCKCMDHRTSGLPVHHQWLEFTQTHLHWVGDAIQSSHPLSSPSPAFNLTQHQGLFQWVSALHQVARVLELQLQHQSFQWTPRMILWDGLVGSPCSPSDSQESSPTPQFKSINSLVLSFLYNPTLTCIHDYWKNHSLDEIDHEDLFCTVLLCILATFS